MQALARPASALVRSGPLQRAVVILTGLALASGLRAALNGHTPASALLAGTGFGAVLTAMAVLAGWRPRRPSIQAVSVGLAGGAVLLILPRLVGAGVIIRPGVPPEPVAAWFVATFLVAAAEELVLRGALLDAITDRAGLGAAIAVTSGAFALMHVPLYGWGVVPLDFGVGLWFAGLRLAGGGLAAPAVAHVLADIATWWL